MLGSNRGSGDHRRVGYEAVSIGTDVSQTWLPPCSELSKKSMPRQEVLKNLNNLHGVLLQDAISLMKLVVTHRHTVLQQIEETWPILSGPILVLKYAIPVVCSN